MIMNYDEYIKLVPKETAEFVNLVLKLFEHYICEENAIWIKDRNEYEFAIDHSESKIFAILLAVKYYQNINDATRIILDKCELKEEFIDKFNIDKLKENKIDYNDVFNKTANVFLPFEYYENYMYLTPERIIYQIYCDKKYYDNQVNYLFSSSSKWKDIFSNKYSEYVKNNEADKINDIEKTFYKDLSYDVINYLETAARIFKYFVEHKKPYPYNSSSYYNIEIIKTDDDIVLASLILALYSVDNKVFSFLETKGITKSKCTYFLIRGSNKYFVEPPTCATILCQFFNKYINADSNKEKERKDLTIEDIVSNIFDRNFTNSLVLEKLLHNYKLSITDFADFENQLQNFEKNYELLQRQKKLDEFYKDIDIEIIEFIKFVSKVHKIIKNNFESGKISKKYIIGEDDIRYFAFFISSYFVPNDFINYFKDNDITKEKLMNKLGITISEDEILKLESDINIIVDNNEDIIFGYTNDREQININTILYSLGNCDKVNSSTILNLLKDINPNLRISDYFTNLIIDYNRNQEELRKYQLEQKFFGDMNKDTIKFIKTVSKCYQALENSNKTTQFSRDDLIEIAIYYAEIEYCCDSSYQFLRTLKSGSIGNRLEINKRVINNYKGNIDIIYNYFGKYIFGGKNKDKKKSEITIKDIYTNIFNKDVNNSLTLYKFLDDIGFDYNKFNNFDESFVEYEKNEQIEDVINRLSGENYRHYFENISKIYNHLLDISKDGNLIYSIDKDIDNINNASQLLAMLLETDNNIVNKHLLLLNKRGITIDNYLNYINIKKDDFNKFQTKEIDYLTLYKNFSDCYTYGYSGIDSMVRNLFKQNDNKYRFENFIKYLNQSPEIIAKEMETGEEVIVPLSQDEQLNYLANIPISKLDYNLNSISKFGQELADHSIIIANEFVNIAIQDNGNNRVLDIKEEINKLMKKPSIFSRKIPVSEKIAHNKEILDNLTEILKENETRMIEVIEHFTYLKKLIAIYVYRLNNYIEELKYNLENFENNPNNKKQNIFDALDSNTIKQTLNIKLSDYQTSLNISLQQYNKINLVLNNYLLNLSKTSTARNTTIPNLYIELSIRDSILLEQDSISDLNEINNLLSNIVKTNNELLDKNTFKIGKNNKNALDDKSLSESISEVLKAEHLLEQNDDNKEDANKTLVKKK